MSSLVNRRVHVAVCGGVAAYKAVETVRLLQKAGAVVQVAMTTNAQAFVGPLTFQAITHLPVLTRTNDPSDEMEIGHIAFAQENDVLLVVPASANILAKCAAGIGDEVVSTVLLATRPRRSPVLFAPAMNTAMYENEATQNNLRILRERGYQIVEPDAGALACGAVGTGRLAVSEVIVDAVVAALTPRVLVGRRVLVTAGPTREFFDPVRFLSNPSTGKAGFEIAAAAARAGAEVTLIHGPCSLPLPPGVSSVAVTTAIEMHAAVVAHLPGVDVVVMTAAVSDYRARAVSATKVKKLDEVQSLELVRNPDILAELGASRFGASPLLIGFAAESGPPLEYARAKLISKRCDLIVANDITAEGAGFGVDTNRVSLVTAEGIVELPLLSKAAIGERLVVFMAERLAGSPSP